MATDLELERLELAERLELESIRPTPEYVPIPKLVDRVLDALAAALGEEQDPKNDRRQNEREREFEQGGVRAGLHGHPSKEQ